jgi:hypothetical protein
MILLVFSYSSVIIIYIIDDIDTFARLHSPLFPLQPYIFDAKALILHTNASACTYAATRSIIAIHHHRFVVRLAARGGVPNIM